MNNKRGYLDPSMGSMLLSSIWGFIVVVFTTVMAFILRWFKRNKKESK